MPPHIEIKHTLTFLFFLASVAAFGQSIPENGLFSTSGSGSPTTTNQSAATNDTTTASTAFTNRSDNGKIFHVDDFGAVGDSNGTTGNGTENTAALQAAITAAIAATPSTVIIGRGIYRYTGNLTLFGSGVTVVGYGQGISTLFNDKTSSGPHFNIIGNDITVHDLTIQGMNSFTSNGVGLSLGGNNNTAHDVEVKAANCFGIYINRGKNVDVHHCHVWGGAADGIHASISLTNFKVHHNTIHDNGDDAIGVGYEGAAQHGVISNNILYNNATGVTVMGYDKGSSPLVYDITVSNNKIYNTWLEGIRLHVTQGGLKNVTVSGNTIEDSGLMARTSDILMRGVGVACGLSLLATTTSDGYDSITIEGNMIFNPKNNFMRIGEGTSGTRVTPGNILIQNNFCSGIAGVGGVGRWGFGAGGSQNVPTPTDYSGIYIGKFSDVKVQDNVIIGSYKDANLNTSSGNSIVLSIRNEFLDDNFSIYPNPVGNQLNVRPNDPTIPFSLELYTSAGFRINSLYEETSDGASTIDFSGLASGTYILQVKRGSNVAGVKVVKE